MTQQLELFFLTNENKKAKLVVPAPKPDLTPAQIGTVMDLIIQKNLFGFPQGVAVSKVEARIVGTDVQKISL